MRVRSQVNILQSGNGPRTPADTLKSSGEGNTLGLVPHQIRGFLGNFSQLLVVGRAYDRCTGCSPAVLRAYLRNPLAFVAQACASSAFLEDLTGLTALKDEPVDFGSADEDFSME